MEFKDKRLEKMLKYKVGKFSKDAILEDGDLDKVIELTVNNRSIARARFKYFIK